jgi:hypothetical protein
MFQAAEHARKLRECNGIGLAERVENRAIVIPALRRPHTKVRDSSQSLQTSPALSPHRQTDQWEGSSQSWQTSNNWQAREVLVNRGSEQQSPGKNRVTKIRVGKIRVGKQLPAITTRNGQMLNGTSIMCKRRLGRQQSTRLSP